VKYLLLEVLGEDGEDITPRPLVLIDPFTIYDTTTAAAGKTPRGASRRLVCHKELQALGSGNLWQI